MKALHLFEGYQLYFFLFCRKNKWYYKIYCIILNTLFAALIPLLSLIYLNIRTVLGKFNVHLMHKGSTFCSNVILLGVKIKIFVHSSYYKRLNKKFLRFMQTVANMLIFKYFLKLMLIF